MRPILRKLHPKHPLLRVARAYRRVWKGICGGATWNDISHNANPILAKMQRDAREALHPTSRIAE